MEPSEYDITGEWLGDAEGWQYEAIARTKSPARRQIARATGHLGVDAANDLESCLPVDAQKLVEESVRSACDAMARHAPG